MSRQTNPSSRNAGGFIGALFALAAILLNKWAIERVVAPDEYLESTIYWVAIPAFQVALLLIGAWFAFGASSVVPQALRKTVVSGLIAAIAFGVYGNLRVAGVIDPNREVRQAWETMVESEELLLSLQSDLKKVAASAMNLRVPDHLSLYLFEDEIEVLDLSDEPTESHNELVTVGVDSVDWPVASRAHTVPATELSLWDRALSEVRYFEFTKFYVIRGRFLDDGHRSYEADVGFDALGRPPSGAFHRYGGKLAVRWNRHDSPDDAEPRWLIAGIHTKEFHSMVANELLFEEVLSSALSSEDWMRATRSRHEEYVLESMLDPEGFEAPHPWFYIAAVDRHPGISVVDIDADGLDDLYVMERHTKNMLFRNRGDGTFEEVADRYGLAIGGATSSAIFADFDNDGDPDVFLGQTLEPSRYMENVDGRFVHRPEAYAEMPLLVSSTSAVDFNQDGLLDIYFSTYGAQMLSASAEDLDVLHEYFAEEDLERLEELLDPDVMGNKSMNYPGPPNVLLQNMGNGRFARPEGADGVRVYRNTYQSTWADYDDDGDADVYLANDFAPNNLLRNDGGVFVDVTAETGTADIGFGMGASWGDYDNDARLDLYVSNMYSKAGRRITAQLGSLDPRFGQMARGNSLFRNDGESFSKVSGTEAPALLVEAAGWSWGSQFIDVDNDGFQDLFALAGHYTAPQEVSSDVDI